MFEKGVYIKFGGSGVKLKRIKLKRVFVPN